MIKGIICQLRRDHQQNLDQENKLLFSLFTAGWIISDEGFLRYKGGEFHEIKS
jgi:hypothetical protein